MRNANEYEKSSHKEVCEKNLVVAVVELGSLDQKENTKSVSKHSVPSKIVRKDSEGENY